MTILSPKFKNVSRSETEDKTTYTQSYECVATGSEDEVSVLSAVAVSLGKTMGSVYPYDASAYMTSNNINSIDGGGGVGIKYAISYTYTNDGKDENPLNDPVEYSGSFETYERVLEKDEAGNAILNSAGENFEPGVTGEDCIIIITAKKNVASPTNITTYANKVNSATFKNGPAGTVLCALSSTGPKERNEIEFYEEIYTFKYKESGWKDIDVLDKGFRKLSGGKLVPIMIDGREVSEAHLLDGAGDVLAVGNDPVFETFTVKGEVDFSGLGV